MAQKQYEMLFQLNAKLGSQYSSTLKAAQSELLRFNQEYKNLSATANDISAYQRQQAAVENTKDKLALLQQQYDNIQREMEETGGFSSDLENKLLSKRAQIEKTTKAYSDQTARLDEYKRRLEEAGVDTSELEKETERLHEELKQIKTGYENAGEGAEDFGEKGASSVETVSTMLAAAGITKMLKEIYDAFSDCVSVAADFEASMSNVEAISGANGAELAELTERAKELGASTAFTAQQVSEGMSYMAMAGWKTEDMLAGMDSVLSLAAASGEDLGSVSDIVTDALTAFGLTAKDTGRFADILAAASANANTNVGMMGETFKYAAPVAGALGYSVEDVAVAVGLMANSGIKASQAGTTLRNIFNGILEGVDLTSEAFGELNVSFVNSDGTMQDLASSMNTLRGYFDQMTEAERVQNAINIAGQRGYSGLLAILRATSGDYDKLTKAINNSSGAAQRMANVKLDNLNGQLTIAKSAWEGVEIAVGDELTPAMEKIYKIFGKVSSELASFIKQNPGLVKGIAAVTTGLGVFVGGLAAYVAVTKIAAAAQAALNAAMMSNPYLLAGAAIAGLVAGVGALILSLDDGTSAVEEFQASIAELESARDESLASVQATATVAQRYISELKEMEEAGIETTEQQREYHNILVLLTETVPELADLIDLETDTIKGGTSALEANTEAWRKNAQQQAFNEYLTGVYQEQAEAMVQAELASIALTKQRDKEAVEAKKYQDVIDQLYDMEMEAQAAAKEALGEYDWERNWTGWLPLEYDQLQQEADLLQELWSDEQVALAKAQADYDDKAAAAELAKGALEEAQAAVDDLTESLWGSVPAAETSTEGINAMGDALAPFQEQIAALSENYQAAYEAAYTSIMGQYKLWDEVAEVAATSVEDVIGNLEKQKQYWSDYNSNIQLLLSYSGEIEGLSDMVATFGDGSAESVNMIAGMAEAAKSGDPTQIQALVTAWKENKAAQDEAAESLGDLMTGYSDQMAEIKDQIAADVEGMDFSAESYSAAQATIEAFIAGAGDMMPAVQRAYAQLAAVANNALTQSYYRQYYSYRSDHGQAYASGTDNASPGLHLVGEYGPEIVALRGGERVLDADRTRDILEALQPREPLNASLPAPSSFGVGNVKVDNYFTIHEANRPQALLDMIPDITEDVKRAVMEALDEEAEDRVRCYMR